MKSEALFDKSKTLQLLQAESFSSAVHNGIREQVITVHPRVIYCRWHSSATTRVVRVLGILELPGMVALVLIQARIVIVRIKVFENAGEDLRQPLSMLVCRMFFNA